MLIQGVELADCQVVADRKHELCRFVSNAAVIGIALGSDHRMRGVSPATAPKPTILFCARFEERPRDRRPHFRSGTIATAS